MFLLKKIEGTVMNISENNYKTFLPLSPTFLPFSLSSLIPQLLVNLHESSKITFG